MINFTKINQLKGLKLKNKVHTNFYEYCELQKSISKAKYNSHSVASISEPKIQFVNLYVNCQLWLSFIKIVVGIFVYWKTLEMFYMLHMHQDVHWLLYLCQIDIVMVWCWGGINSIKIVIELNIGFWTVPISYININCSVAFWEIKSCETKFSIQGDA